MSLWDIDKTITNEHKADNFAEVKLFGKGISDNGIKNLKWNVSVHIYAQC